MIPLRNSRLSIGLFASNPSGHPYRPHRSEQLKTGLTLNNARLSNVRKCRHRDRKGAENGT
jgi:hypothetical protein